MSAARQRVARLLPAALLGILAFALVVEITEPPNPGLDPDAMAYLGAAESLVTRAGYRVPSAPWYSADSTAPLAHFPPGYSTVLALPVRLGMAPPQAARVVQGLAALVTVMTVVLLVGGATAPIAGVFCALALLATPAMYEVHQSVLSEPLFLACVVLTLAAMTLAPDRPLRMGIPAALGAITRYAGVSLVASVALWQLARGGPRGVRVRRAVVAVLPAVLLLGAWVIRTRAAAGPGAIRRVGVYGGFGPTLNEARDTMRDWIVPAPEQWAAMPVRGSIAVIAGILLAFLVAGAARRARGQALLRRADDRPEPPAVDAWRLLRASTLLLAFYVVTVATSRLVADAHIPFDDRIMSPALLLATVILATAIGIWWDGVHGGAPRTLLAAALLAWWTAAAAVTRERAHYARDWGADFAASQWRRSPALDWARTAGARSVIYSNWPSAVYFHLHRTAHELPRRSDVRALSALPDTLRARRGRILAFDVDAPGIVTKATLLRQPGLRVIAVLEDGVVLAPQ